MLQAVCPLPPLTQESCLFTATLIYGFRIQDFRIYDVRISPTQCRLIAAPQVRACSFWEISTPTTPECLVNQGHKKQTAPKGGC